MGTTQTETVKKHLLTIGPLTQLEALRRYGIMRLGARIWNIRGELSPFYKIVTNYKRVKTRTGKAVIAEYCLVGDSMGVRTCK